MKLTSIEIDQEVLAELSKHAVGFNVTPNTVLRSLLKLPSLETSPTPGSSGSSAASPAGPQNGDSITTSTSLMALISRPEFSRLQQAVDRFLVVLGYLNAQDPDRFTRNANSFSRGRRTYFAHSEKEVLSSGEGLTAKPIPKSSWWALTTLDNKSKRSILESFLLAFNFPSQEIQRVLATLPDSGIRRSRGNDLLRGL